MSTVHRYVSVCVLLFVFSIAAAAQDRPSYETDRRYLTQEELRQFRMPKEAASITVGALKKAKALPPDYRPRAGMSLPLLFEENRGQSDSRAGFVVRHAAYAARFSSSEMLAAVHNQPEIVASPQRREVRGDVFRLSFDNARDVEPKGIAPEKAVVNVMRGPDRGRWQLGVPLHGGIQYSDLYPSIDLYFSGSSGALEYGFVVHPQAKPETIRMRIGGARSLELDRSGNLAVRLGGGSIVITHPATWEKTTSGVRELKSDFVITGRNSFTFKVAGRTPSSTLLIDPRIVFSTYFGGSASEGDAGLRQTGARELLRRGFDLSVVSPGQLFVAGQTTSPDFPATIGAFTANFNATLLKVDSAAMPPALRWASVFGGSSSARATGVAALPDQTAYVCGDTTSPDFPPSAAPAFRGPRPAGGAFIVHLDTDGVIDDGTLIGSTAPHLPSGIAWDAKNKSVVVAGTMLASGSDNSDATEDAFLPVHAGVADGFVMKLDHRLATVDYFTFLGGASFDVIRGVAAHDGDAYVTGATSSTNFPTSDQAHQRVHSRTATDCPAGSTQPECFDIFIARFNDSGTKLIYSTLFGTAGEDYGRAIVVDPSGTAHISGADTYESAEIEEKLTTLIATVTTGGDLVHMTSRLYYQQPGEHGEDIALSQFGAAHTIATSAPEAAQAGGTNIFLGRRAGSFVLEGLLFGGNGNDAGYSLGSDGPCLYLAGATESVDVPLEAPLQEQNRGGSDLYLAAYCDEAQPRLFKTVTENHPIRGETFAYEITIINGTGRTIAGTLIDTLPVPFTVVSAEGSFSCNTVTRPIRCAVLLQPEGVSTVRITVRGNECGTFTNVARLLMPGRPTLETPPVTVTVFCPEFEIRCGDGNLHLGETCDDGNLTNGDGCRDNCTPERCGDGIIDPQETCDPPGDWCDDKCNEQTPSGELCTPTTAPCQAGTICGRKCFSGEECLPFPLFFFCDTIGWCEEFTCRAREEGVIELEK